MEFKPTYASVVNEGCTLHYYYQGTGPLITFIPGGSGTGLQFSPLISFLSSSYTCLSYDRRQMSLSHINHNHNLKPLSHPQQARDVLAIIRSLGFSKSILFGSSLGGIIAFQFAIDFPDMVDALICHEAPTISILPNATEVYNHLYHCQQLYLSSGLSSAQKEFRKLFKGFDDPDLPLPLPTTPQNNDEITEQSKADPRNERSFWDYEFWTASMYCPDLRKVKSNGTKVVVMAGKRSGDDCFAVATKEQADILGCERVVVPGHHRGFDVEAEAFLPFLVGCLERLRGGEEGGKEGAVVVEK